MAAVYSGFDSKTAAKTFNVPASTIRRHRLNAVIRPRIGRPSYFSDDQESYFVSILQLLPDYGFKVSRDVALELAKEYCLSLGLNHCPGSKWLRLFMLKHSNDIKWMKEEKMESCRADSFTEEVRTGWFSLVKDVMTKNNLFDKPNQIFNLDESGFSDKTTGISVVTSSNNIRSVLSSGEWVIVNSNRRHTYETNGGSAKNYFTVLIAINAGGLVLPPFVIYEGKHLMDSWCCGGPPGTCYAVTEKVRFYR